MPRKIVIDAHADTLLKEYLADTFELLTGYKTDYHVTREKLLQGGTSVQIFAIFIPVKMENFAVEFTLNLIANAMEKAEKEGYIRIKSKKDLKKIENSTDPGMILSLEGAAVLERNTELVPVFHDLGVKAVGLTWSRPNLFGEGVSTDLSDGSGLTTLGKDLVQQLEASKIIVDVSHLNKEGFTDVVRNTSNPFIASHSNSFNLCPVNRNLTDDQLMDISSAGGVVGINFYPGFLNENPEKATIDDVIKHIVYISEKAGIENAGLGSDFDGIPKGPVGLEDASKVKSIPALLLEKAGFSNNDIDKVMGGNFERIINKIWD